MKEIPSSIIEYNKFVKEVKSQKLYTTKRSISLLRENHARSVNLFSVTSLNERNEQKQQIVVNNIKSNRWEEPNPVSFKNALNKSKHKEMLTDYSTSELKSMKLYKLDGFDIGYALKLKDGRHSEIVAVFNNESDIKGIGNLLMASAISNGGCYLDHFDGFLSNMYQSIGFEEYDRYEFDPQYDEDGAFRKKYGEADVIFRKHKSCK